MYKKKLSILAIFLTALSGCANHNAQHANTQGTPNQIVIDNQRLVLPTPSQGIKPTWVTSTKHSHDKSDQYALTASAASAVDAASKAYRSTIKLLHPIAESKDHFQGQIKIAALWHSPLDNKYHALAVIERQHGYDYLRHKLDSLDALTESDVDKLKQSREPLAQIALLNRVIERQQLRAAYQKSLKKIDLAKEGRESPWDTRRWSLQLADLLQGLLITPQIDGHTPSTQTLAKTLEEGIANTGLRRARPFEADYTLTGHLETRERQLKNGYVQATGTLSLTLEHIETKERYGSKDWHLEATSLTPEDARTRLLSKTQHILKQNHRDTIVGIASQTQP